MEEKVKFEKVNEFFQWLIGEKSIDRIRLKSNQIKLSRYEAFNIIYVLQEHLGIIPDTFEMCSICGELFDEENSEYGYVSLETGCEADNDLKEHNFQKEKQVRCLTTKHLPALRFGPFVSGSHLLPMYFLRYSMKG
jgi:hypothetical protein